MNDVRVFRGCLVVDLVLPYARSIKDRRKPLQAVVQRLRNQDLAVAQVGPTDLIQRAYLSVAAVSGSDRQLRALLDAAERIVFASEFEVADLRCDVTSDCYRAP
jgi:uncharacterized protein YlxP (DUF503 family)